MQRCWPQSLPPPLPLLPLALLLVPHCTPSPPTSLAGGENLGQQGRQGRQEEGGAGPAAARHLWVAHHAGLACLGAAALVRARGGAAVGRGGWGVLLCSRCHPMQPLPLAPAPCLLLPARRSRFIATPVWSGRARIWLPHACLFGSACRYVKHSMGNIETFDPFAILQVRRLLCCCVCKPGAGG